MHDPLRPQRKKNTFSIDTWHDLSQKACLVTLGFQDQRESSRDPGFENPRPTEYGPMFIKHSFSHSENVVVSISMQ